VELRKSVDSRRYLQVKDFGDAASALPQVGSFQSRSTCGKHSRSLWISVHVVREGDPS